MIAHASLHVTDFDKAKAFYLKALEPLHYEMITEFPEWSVAGFGEKGKPDMWIHADGNKQATHLAFSASSKEMVDAFYKAAMEAGAKDNGKPGYRKEYSPGYYGAFVFDLDGHNIEAVFQDPTPSE